MTQPTPIPSEEGSNTRRAESKFPSLEGLGVGSARRCASTA